MLLCIIIIIIIIIFIKYIYIAQDREEAANARDSSGLIQNKWNGTEYRFCGFNWPRLLYALPAACGVFASIGL